MTKFVIEIDKTSIIISQNCLLPLFDCEKKLDIWE